MEPRLKTRIRVQAVIRLAEQRGGQAMVLHGGDDNAGDLMLVMIEGTGNARLFRRTPGTDFNHIWSEVPAPEGIASDAPEQLVRLTTRDPDLWIIEVSVPDMNQFIADVTFAA